MKKQKLILLTFCKVLQVPTVHDHDALSSACKSRLTLSKCLVHVPLLIFGRYLLKILARLSCKSCQDAEKSGKVEGLPKIHGEKWEARHDRACHASHVKILPKERQDHGNVGIIRFNGLSIKVFKLMIFVSKMKFFCFHTLTGKRMCWTKEVDKFFQVRRYPFIFRLRASRNSNKLTFQTKSTFSVISNSRTENLSRFN